MEREACGSLVGFALVRQGRVLLGQVFRQRVHQHLQLADCGRRNSAGQAVGQLREQRRQRCNTTAVSAGHVTIPRTSAANAERGEESDTTAQV